jgi:formate/nitrite transporter FocA (FNT family)
VLTWLIATVIGYTRLHHVVVGSVEVLAGVFSAQEVPATKYLHFLFWTTIGNSIGGPFFVAIIKYSHAIGGESGSERGDQLTLDRTGGAERDMRIQERFW